MNPSITSAALYFEPMTSIGIHSDWVSEINRLFLSLDLAFHEYELTAKGFPPITSLDFKEYQDQLNLALKGGAVRALGLYSTLENYKQLAFGWNGFAHIDLDRGVFFLGIDGSRIDNPVIVLQDAYELSNKLTSVLYGVSYKRLLLQGPFFYAVGLVAGLGYDKESIREADHISSWRREMSTTKGYLRGLFRGAYPANILNEAHTGVVIEDSLCGSGGIGSLRRLDSTRWLWELSENEIPMAESVIEKAGLLIK